MYDIRRYDVHLVLTGRPGSHSESIEYRVSGFRAKMVALRRLQLAQKAYNVNLQKKRERTSE